MSTGIHKAKYRKLCSEEPTIPIFARDWWLDAVCGDAWDVCLVEKAGRVIAAMPYHYRTNCLGMTVISQPQETQALGPWLRPSESKTAIRLGQEKKLMADLISQLPKFSHFHQTWHHTRTNWLPFFWHGFHQTTQYTYRIPDLSDLEKIWAGFRDNIRTDIRKAKAHYHLNVHTQFSIDDFLILNAKTFERQNKSSPCSKSFIKRLDDACANRGARAIFICVDSEGRHHAGTYIVWDGECAYYLMGGGDPGLRSSGATSLCLWAAIQFAASKSKSFDFEGSMIEPIERFFRAFGAIQTPYFSIQKTPSKIFQIAKTLRKFLIK